MERGHTSVVCVEGFKIVYNVFQMQTVFTCIKFSYNIQMSPVFKFLPVLLWEENLEYSSSTFYMN